MASRAKSSSRAEETPLRLPFRRPPQPAVPEGERVYAVGDVHGRLDLLDALLDRIEEDSAGRGPGEVTVLLLGDLVDRGPDSAGVVERAMGWKRGFARLDSLLGNHDAAMVASLRGDFRWFDAWLGFGGVETLQSYGVDQAVIATGDPYRIAAAARACVPAEHLRWLADRPTAVRKGGYLFVHAGVRPGRRLDRQEREDLLWIRHEFLGSRANHGAMIVHGHSIVEEIDEQPNRIGIDTGAFSSGRLTAIGLEAMDRWYLQT